MANDQNIKDGCRDALHNRYDDFGENFKDLLDGIRLPEGNGKAALAIYNIAKGGAGLVLRNNPYTGLVFTAVDLGMEMFSLTNNGQEQRREQFRSSLILDLKTKIDEGIARLFDTSGFSADSHPIVAACERVNAIAQSQGLMQDMSRADIAYRLNNVLRHTEVFGRGLTARTHGLTDEYQTVVERAVAAWNATYHRGRPWYGGSYHSTYEYLLYSTLEHAVLTENDLSRIVGGFHPYSTGEARSGLQAALSVSQFHHVGDRTTGGRRFQDWILYNMHRLNYEKLQITLMVPAQHHSAPQTHTFHKVWPKPRGRGNPADTPADPQRTRRLDIDLRRARALYWRNRPRDENRRQLISGAQKVRSGLTETAFMRAWGGN